LGSHVLEQDTLIKYLLNRYGVIKTTVFVSVTCIIVSLLITATFWEYFGLQNLGFVLLVAFLCPTFIAPPVIFALCHLTENIQKNKKELETYKNSLETMVEERTKELKKALDELKTLKGILPICSYCKMIRDDQGNWNEIDVYIRKHSEAEFTHGICPGCLKKHYPEN